MLLELPFHRRLAAVLYLDPVLLAADRDALRPAPKAQEPWAQAVLIRRDLTPPQRAKLIAKRKAAYEAVHPETKHGATGAAVERVLKLRDLTVSQSTQPQKRQAASNH